MAASDGSHSAAPRLRGTGGEVDPADVAAKLVPASEVFTLSDDQAARLASSLAPIQKVIAAVYVPTFEAIAARQRELISGYATAFAMDQHGISDLWAPGLQTLVDQQAQLFVGFAQSTQLANHVAILTANASTTLEQVAEAWISPVDVFEAFRLPDGFLEQFRRLVWEVPESWPDDRSEDVMEMIRSTDVPIGSITPTHVVQACLDTHDSGGDPFEVLYEHYGELVDALAEFAAGEGLPEHADARRSLRELIDLLRLDRYHRSVIRDAFAIVDQLLYRVTHRNYGEIEADRIIGPVDGLTVIGTRQRLVIHCLAPCYEYFDKSSGSPPGRLNRHAAVHTTNELQATRDNALVAAMLAANLIDAYYHEPVPA